MRGSIIKRSKASWALVIDHGRVNGKRVQKWVKFEVPRDRTTREATKLAEAELAKLLHQTATGTYIDASKTTFVEYLRRFHTETTVTVKGTERRPETSRVYLSMVEKHIATAPIGNMPIQKVRARDLEAFYASVTLAPSSLNVLHATIARPMRLAARDGLIATNPAALVENRPRPHKDRSKENARKHCWSPTQARGFLTAAQAAGTQVGAFFSVALATGARKSELLGLQWADVDFDAGTIAIKRQLDKAGEHPTYGPTKTRESRTVAIDSETVSRLRQHKKEQAALKLRNRTTYKDHGLVFACESADLTTPAMKLGLPCVGLTTRHFAAVTKAAGLPRMKFHGLRHSAATLLMGAGVPVHVVAQHLGHAQVKMTLDVYAHALSDAQADAARRLGDVLHGPVASAR